MHLNAIRRTTYKTDDYGWKTLVRCRISVACKMQWSFGISSETYLKHFSNLISVRNSHNATLDQPFLEDDAKTRRSHLWDVEDWFEVVDQCCNVRFIEFDLRVHAAHRDSSVPAHTRARACVSNRAALITFRSAHPVAWVCVITVFFLISGSSWSGSRSCFGPWGSARCLWCSEFSAKETHTI